VTITVETMRDKLLSVDHVRTILKQTEPMTAHPFTVGDSIRFRAEQGWNHGMNVTAGNDPVGIFVTLNRGRFAREFQLTRSTLEETCMAFGFRRDYVKDCPAELLTPHMNYWFREGLLTQPRKKKDFQFLVSDDSAVAFARQSLLPFSNLKLLDQALSGIQAKHGNVEVLVDYKFSHTLRATYLRLIVPNGYRILTDTGTAEDVWSTGIQIKNSLTGSTQTSIEGYLFRWVCTNGQIDTHANQGVWTRKPTATEAEVYQWARQAVDDVLGGLEGSLDKVQELTSLRIDGRLSDTLRDVFEHYKIPIHQRSKIIKHLEEYDGEITMYVIMNAITQVANDSTLEATTVDSLLRVGGDLPYTASQRCGACRRLLHSH
jgi:hypothetical protein